MQYRLARKRGKQTNESRQQFYFGFLAWALPVCLQMKVTTTDASDMATDEPAPPAPPRRKVPRQPDLHVGLLPHATGCGEELWHAGSSARSGRRCRGVLGSGVYACDSYVVYSTTTGSCWQKACDRDWALTIRVADTNGFVVHCERIRYCAGWLIGLRHWLDQRGAAELEVSRVRVQ